MLRTAVNRINQNHARGSRGSAVCYAAPSSHSNTHLSNSSRLFIGTGSKGENPQHTVREEYEQAQLYVNEINICNKVQTKQFPLPDYSSGQALQERARVRCNPTSNMPKNKKSLIFVIFEHPRKTNQIENLSFSGSNIQYPKSIIKYPKSKI
jgi:hypothetical protein